MRAVFLSLGLVCLAGLAVDGQTRSRSFFDFFFDVENRLQNGRIVGGSTATIARYPFVASLRRFSNHICTASIISTLHAATGAHCTYSFKSLSGVSKGKRAQKCARDHHRHHHRLPGFVGDHLRGQHEPHDRWPSVRCDGQFHPPEV